MYYFIIYLGIGYLIGLIDGILAMVMYDRSNPVQCATINKGMRLFRYAHAKDCILYMLIGMFKPLLWPLTLPVTLIRLFIIKYN